MRLWCCVIGLVVVCLRAEPFVPIRPIQKQPRTSTEEDAMFKEENHIKEEGGADEDMTDKSPSQETLDAQSRQDDKDFFENIDLSGDYDKYLKSIQKYEDHHLSKEKKESIQQELKEQYEAQKVEETLQYQQIASELLDKEIEQDKLENSHYYLYDQDRYKEDDAKFIKEKEQRVAKQIEQDNKPYIERHIVLTEAQIEEINRLAEEFYQEELGHAKQEMKDYAGELQARIERDREQTNATMDNHTAYALQHEQADFLQHQQFMERMAIDRGDYAYKENTQLMHKYEEYMTKSEVASWNIYMPKDKVQWLGKEVKLVPDDLYFLVVLDGMAEIEENELLPIIEVYSPAQSLLGSFPMKNRMLELHMELPSPGEYQFKIINKGDTAQLRLASYTKRNSLAMEQHLIRRDEAHNFTQQLVNWNYTMMRNEQATSLQMEQVLYSLDQVVQNVKQAQDVDLLEYSYLNAHLHSTETLMVWYKYIILMEIVVVLVVGIVQIKYVGKQVDRTKQE